MATVTPGVDIQIGIAEETYDSRPDTMKHIMRVKRLVGKVIYNIRKRVANHDASKLVEPELSGFNILTPEFRKLPYGSEEYKRITAHPQLRASVSIHYQNNDHHPQHFPNGVAGMSLMNLVEMICDWKAATERNPTQCFRKAMKYNFEWFGIEGQLQQVLINTAIELGFIDYYE